MLETIVQDHKRLSNFLSAFRDAFKNRPQYRHFQAYVVGLVIYLGSRMLVSSPAAAIQSAAAHWWRSTKSICRW